MARIKLQVGTRYVLDNEIYVVEQMLGAAQYRVAKISSGEISTMKYEDIMTSWSKEHLRFEVMSPNTKPEGEIPLNTTYIADDITDLPASTRAEAWRRYNLILSLYTYHNVQSIQTLSRAQIGHYLSAYQPRPLTEQSVRTGTSVGSLERYLKAFVDSGGDIRSLVPLTAQRGGRRQSRLDDAVERIIKAVLEKYANLIDRESTVDQIMVAVVNAIADENQFRDAANQLVPPNERTIRRRIKAGGEKRILGRKLSRREQRAEADVHPNSQPTRILQRVEIDHTQLDFFVVDESDGLPIGRPYITACIDTYSGIVPGWQIGFQPVSTVSIMLCLRHALLPKPNYQAQYGTEHLYPVYGLFEKLCIDNGRDFKSLALKESLAELGIIREEMPKQAPWFKGSIERYFRSVNQRLLKGKPGYSFGNVLKLGDYDPQKDAVISLTTFLEIFHIFMVDIYPHTWHRGLEAIPMQRWQESWEVFKPDVFENAEVLNIILLPSAERSLQPRGIEWEWNFYQSPALARLRELHGNAKVRFKYNPDDLSVIYVRDVSSPRGWTEFHSTRPDYTQGLSLAKHRVIRQKVYEQKQRVDPNSLARAKAQIQQLIEQEFYTTKQLRRRSRLKPLLQTSTPAEQVSKSPSVKPNLERASKTPLELNGTDWSSDYDLPITRESEA
jgi:putative transposase